MSKQKKKWINDRVLLLVMWCFIPGGLLLAQSPVVKTSVDRTSILIGEQIRYRVEISFPSKTYKLQWFDMPSEKNHFEVVAKDEVDSTITGNMDSFGQTIIFTNFDSGRQVIPSFPLVLTEVNGTKRFTMYTDSIAINVIHSPLDSVQPFHDIKPIIETTDEAGGMKWWMWALIALVIALLLIYFLRKKKRNDAAPELFASTVPPYEEAMGALDKLENDKLLEKGSQKEFHLRLSEIFRRYLTRKTQGSKMHFTTADLMADNSLTGLSKGIHEHLVKSLRMGDAVKFAKYSPSDQESETCRSAIREAITELHTQTMKPEGHDR